MSEATILDSLRGVEFFRDIADDHLKRLAAISRSVEFPARTVIFQENEPAKDVYVIIQGKVSLVICAPKVGCRQLVEISDGELFGWSALVKRARLYDTARTVTPTTAIAIDGDQALKLCGEDTKFGFEFMQRTAKVLAERLASTRMQLLDISGVRLPEVVLESD